MIDWSSAGESAVSTLSVVCVFLLGMLFSMALLMRLFINQLSLDVRDLPPRLQSLVLLDSITFQIIHGGEGTPYARSIRTGKSLDEVNAEIQVEREAQLQRNEERMRKEQEDTDKSMAIVNAFGRAFLIIFIIGVVVLLLSKPNLAQDILALDITWLELGFIVALVIIIWRFRRFRFYPDRPMTISIRLPWVKKKEK